VRLAHPQYSAVVSQSLSRLRSADLLLEQAELLSGNGAGAAEALRVVTWRLAAGVDSDPELLGSSARLARQAGDHPTVERLSGAALSVGGPRADLLLLRGEALLRMGRVAEALEVLRAAEALAPEGELATAVAATLALAHVSVHEGLAEALAVLRTAEGDRPEPALALIRSLIELYFNHATEADRIVEDVAGGFGDSPAEKAIIAAARAQPLAALGHIDAAMEAAQTALAFARATGGTAVPGHTVANGLLTLGIVQLHAGRIDDARRSATDALVEAIDADDEIVTRSIEFLLGRIAADAGRLETSARWYRDTMSGAMTSGPISLYIPGLASLAIVLIAHGDADEARGELDSVPAGVDTGPGGVIARAWLSAHDGDLDAARTSLLAEAAAMAASGHVFLAGTFLLHLARLGGADAAAAPLAALAASSSSPLLRTQAAHAVAEAAGDRHGLATAGEEWSAVGSHLLAAEAFASAARAARVAGEQRLAVSLQSRSDDEAARCEGAATPLLRFTDELTPLTRREREIATLAAEGTSSKDIAAKLFLSTRTVDNHLQSVYGKLGIAGRHELARL
jgi:DNA-binding CsgD family transcriptional regulator/tetratricopeptide (TPR) repeat protein